MGTIPIADVPAKIKLYHAKKSCKENGINCVYTIDQLRILLDLRDFFLKVLYLLLPADVCSRQVPGVAVGLGFRFQQLSQFRFFGLKFRFNIFHNEHKYTKKNEDKPHYRANS